MLSRDGRRSVQSGWAKCLRQTERYGRGRSPPLLTGPRHFRGPRLSSREEADGRVRLSPGGARPGGGPPPDRGAARRQRPVRRPSHSTGSPTSSPWSEQPDRPDRRQMGATASRGRAIGSCRPRRRLDFPLAPQVSGRRAERKRAPRLKRPLAGGHKREHPILRWRGRGEASGRPTHRPAVKRGRLLDPTPTGNAGEPHGIAPSRRRAATPTPGSPRRWRPWLDEAAAERRYWWAPLLVSSSCSFSSSGASGDEAYRRLLKVHSRTDVTTPRRSLTEE
jgi:hypothetical protein